MPSRYSPNSTDLFNVNTVIAFLPFTFGQKVKLLNEISAIHKFGVLSGLYVFAMILIFGGLYFGSVPGLTTGFVESITDIQSCSRFICLLWISATLLIKDSDGW